MRAFIGSGVINRISDRQHAPLQIGSQSWTTTELATKLGVVHTKAARVLSQAAREVGAKNVHDLYKRTTPYTFAAIKGLGETTVYVLWRLFESSGLDPARWAGDVNDDDVGTFRTLKLHELDADKRGRTGSARRSTRQRTSRDTRAALAADKPSSS
jgi:hypothetical protein